jgi:hypothetical protein
MAKQTEEDSARHDLEVKVRGLRRTIETRLDGMDKATDLLARDLRSVPTDTDKQVLQLKLLHEEKFRGLEAQLAQRFADNKLAVDAALTAQKEAVGEQNKSFALATAKSEAAITKQIDQSALAVNASLKAIEDKIADLGGRANRAELAGGRSESRVEEHRISSGNIQAWVGIGVVLFAAVVGFISYHLH